MTVSASGIWYDNGNDWVNLARGAHVEEPLPRQLLGMTLQTNGGGMQFPINQNDEDARIGELFGYPKTGPDVQRIFYTTQNPPWSHMEAIISQGRMPWISLKPNAGGVAGDAAGNNDAFWQNWGTYLAQFFPAKIWFSYDHENDRHAHGGGGASRSNAGWVSYQNDFREAFARIIGLMRGADTTRGLSHVSFGPISTGWGYRRTSNRDPGLSWHPSYDFVGSDPYDFWLTNQGNAYDVPRQLWTPPGATYSSGASEHHFFATDPVGWYQEFHPDWPIPQLITDNLHLFPTRMGIGETGTSFDMKPNSGNTQWIPQEDPDNIANYQGAWITQMMSDVREHMPRMEVVCWFHASTNPIGASGGHPVYFAGPANTRWGAEWAGSIAAYRAEVERPEHHGILTPWNPGGLA